MRADIRTTVISDIEYLEAVRTHVERAAAAANCPQLDRETEEFQLIWSRYLERLSDTVIKQFLTAEP